MAKTTTAKQSNAFQRLFFLESLEAARKKLKKRPKKQPSMPNSHRFIALGVAVLGILVAIAGLAGIKENLSNPGAWATLWVVLVPAVYAIGYLRHAVPMSPTGMGSAAITYAFGIVVTGFVAVAVQIMEPFFFAFLGLFAIPFLFAAGHFGRLLKLHQEGYQV